MSDDAATATRDAKEVDAGTDHPAGSAPPRRARPASTLFGLFFLAVAGSWAAREQQLLDGDELARAVAVALIVLGALGLAASVLIARRRPPSGPRPR